MLVLGPPRSGKGLNTVIPAILDAPGAVVTTSTRPDNLTATMRSRGRSGGPVAVFDPQQLAGLPSSLRWSPVRGCAEPHVTMARARALCSEPSRGMENATFWSQQCYTAVRCLLHAAALGGQAAVGLYRWSLSPIAAEDAVAILTERPEAAPAWDSALESILAADPRQRDSTWSMVPLLDTGRLRTLPFGQGIFLLRSAPPIALELQPWTSRPDAGALSSDRAAVEAELNLRSDRTRR